MYLKHSVTNFWKLMLPAAKRRYDSSTSAMLPNLTGPPAFFLTTTSDTEPRTDFNITMADILRLGHLTNSVHLNYLVDAAWLRRQYPQPARNLPLLLVVGHRRDVANLMEAPNIHTVEAPNLPPFGCHHSKCVLLFYNNGMRLVVHTANLRADDWCGKTQGVWLSPHLPRLRPDVARVARSTSCGATPFAMDVWAYLSSYGEKLQCVREQVAAHDLTGVSGVRFITSIPGVYTGEAMRRAGLLGLHHVLVANAQCSTDSQILAQFSSIGSQDPDWMAFFQRHLTAAASHVPTFNVVFPTDKNIRDCVEGYACGSVIPNLAKYKDQHRFLRSLAHQWIGRWCDRSAAGPHIKTYLSISPRTHAVDWMLLTSANLSKAAWGKMEKKGTQFRVMSYEAGILFLPNQGEKLRLTADSPTAGSLPVPFDYPLTRYAPGDDMWLIDGHYSVPDARGFVQEVCGGVVNLVLARATKRDFQAQVGEPVAEASQRLTARSSRDPAHLQAAVSLTSATQEEHPDSSTCVDHLALLRDMGFNDDEACRHALLAHGGDIDRTVDYLFRNDVS